MATTAPPGEPGCGAADFRLPDLGGNRLTLADVRGPAGLVVAFICNHCPYVRSVLPHLVRDARALRGLGIGVVAINSNDAEAYPEDSWANMHAFAHEAGFEFPYLHDASQDVARAYGAVCTPDFFGFDAQLRLRYRGRLDASRRDLVDDAPRELYRAMRAVAAGRSPPTPQFPSMGCSIKWRSQAP